MAAYIVARVEVTNPEEYMKYASQTPGTVAKFGGRFLAKGGPHSYLEGDGPGRIVIIEFPDRAAAEAWYNSDDYQAILPIRHANSTSDQVLVDGI